MAPVLDKDSSMLLVIDVQEKLAPVISDIATLLARLQILVRGAQMMRIPMMFTEHCPDKIGSTLATLYELAPNATYVEKTWFGAVREIGVRNQIKSVRRRQVVIAGTETHVCVMQTVLGLLELDYEVFLVVDCTGSRELQDKEIAIERLRQAGAIPVTSEMVLFEWLAHADAKCFRDVLGLIKEIEK